VSTSNAIKRVAEFVHRYNSSTSKQSNSKSHVPDLSSVKLSKRIGTGIKQELADLKQFAQYNFKQNVCALRYRCVHYAFDTCFAAFFDFGSVTLRARTCWFWKVKETTANSRAPR
jgi:hypothetical protein